MVNSQTHIPVQPTRALKKTVCLREGRLKLHEAPKRSFFIALLKTVEMSVLVYASVDKPLLGVYARPGRKHLLVSEQYPL